MEIALLAVIAIEGIFLISGLRSLIEAIEKLKLTEKHDPQDMQGYFAAFAAATKAVPPIKAEAEPPVAARKILRHHDLAHHEAINK